MISETTQQQTGSTQAVEDKRLDLSTEELKKLKRADELELIEIPILKDRVRL